MNTKAKEIIFEAVLKGCEKNNILPPDQCFITEDDMFKYAVNKYFTDKKEYSSLGIWPKRAYSLRDRVWAYYQYLKITDYSVDLDNYFDFKYDTTKWTRDKIVSVINSYGKNIMFSLALYLKLNIDEPFNEWYEKYKNTEYDALKNVKEYLESQKSTRK